VIALLGTGTALVVQKCCTNHPLASLGNLLSMENFCLHALCISVSAI